MPAPMNTDEMVRRQCLRAPLADFFSILLEQSIQNGREKRTSRFLIQPEAHERHRLDYL